MNESKLEMYYHPAKKEVKFKRYQNETEVEVGKSLTHYMNNERGKFILQNCGKKFFSDIENAFNGEEVVKIKAITTNLDFDDFKQMVEYYNENNKNKKFRIELLEQEEKLMDMDVAFEKIKSYGEEVVKILKNQKLEIENNKGKYDNIKENTEHFMEIFDKEILTIESKIKSLYDNTVNICLTGVYSSGKSALINAILGKNVLPVSIKSETNKMFEISSPKDNERISIDFKINDKNSKISWFEEEKKFKFEEGPSENEIRKLIQNKLNKINQKEQINEILYSLNKEEVISSSIDFFIKVKFPVSIDNERIQYKIYDTPGTGSNFIEHKEVLKEALKEQTHSILMFVLTPDKIEGEANNDILKFIKDAGEKNRTSIDIDRSIFIMNKIDTISKENDKEKLKEYEITGKKEEGNENNSISISLKDKKLFFTSAINCYVARTVKNNVATEEEKGIYEDDKTKVLRNKYYKLNHIANSEYLTNKMINKCDNEFEKSKDEIRKIEIASGVYALEEEIKSYGEKYSSSVKTFAIIDTIDKTLNTLSNEINLLMKENTKGIEEIDKEINELKKEFENILKKKSEEYIEKIRNENNNKELAKKLFLDEDSIHEKLIEPGKKEIDKVLSGFRNAQKIFGLDMSKDGKDKKVISGLRSSQKRYIKNYKENRKKLLEKSREEFLEEIKYEVKQNQGITEEAKNYILDIPEVGIPELETKNLDSIIVENTKKFFAFEFIDVNAVKNKYKENVRSQFSKLYDEYIEEYKKSLEIIISKIEKNFRDRIEIYSKTIKNKIEHKEKMKNLGSEMEEIVKEIEGKQKNLENIIWGSKKYE